MAKESLLAAKSASGSLSKGEPIARHATGGMLRTLSAAGGSSVAKRSPSGRIGIASGGRGTFVTRHSPGGAIGTMSRARGSGVARKAASGTGMRTLSQARGSGLARTAVTGLTPTYKGKSAITTGTVVTRALKPGAVEKVSPAELPGYHGPVYRARRKRSIAVTGMGNIPLLCAGGPMYMPSLTRPGSYDQKKYLELKRK